MAETVTREAYEALDGRRVDFCQLFASPEYDLDAVVDGIRAVVGEQTALIGCTSAGEFVEHETNERSITVALVSTETHRFFTGLGTGLGADVEACVREAAESLPAQVEGYPYLAAINLHDGLVGVGEQVALATQRVLGQHVGLAGGSAGDDMRLEATQVVCGDEIVEDGVALALIASKERIAIAVDHGHEPISEPIEVTAAEGNVVIELDGKPAFERWKEVVREPVLEEHGIDVERLSDDSDDLGRLMTNYEFGIDQGQSFKMRWPGHTSTTDGPLRFAVRVHEGTVFRVMYGPPERQIESAVDAVKAAKSRLGETEIAGAFVYDCACRSAILGDEFSTSVDAMSTELGTPMAGIETYGEMCMERGQLGGYHNTTTVVMLLPD